MKGKGDKRPSESFIMGVVALVFLVIGYQVALFLHRSALLRIEAGRDRPDTVYIYEHQIAAGEQKVADGEQKGSVRGQREVVRKNAVHSSKVEAVRQNLPRQRIESFRFDPNTASADDLCRLGFSAKQAQSIINYRQKGGRFRRKSDFAKSYVVSDSVYRRLEPYISIPMLDLNLADSAAFDALPGIGGWFASKMVEHRQRLGGYSYKEQLMDIWKFDRQKYDALSDLVTVAAEHTVPYPLWTAPADSLRLHPYICNYETARSIVMFRDNNPRNEWTIQKLSAAGILSVSAAEKLSRCVIKAP